MSILTEVIARVRAQCPGFQTVQHVFTPGETLALPAALVGPVEYAAAPDDFLDDAAIRQDVRLTFGVYIMLERKSDPLSGSTAVDTFESLHAEVVAALQGWKPSDENADHLIYAGGQLRPFETGAPAVWRDDFSTVTRYPS